MEFLRPKGVDTKNLDSRKMEDGQFRNPPKYSQLGGFTSAEKGKWERNKMSLEKGGPKAVSGRPI